MLNDILSSKKRGVATDANIELLLGQIFILLCALACMIIEGCCDIFEHIVTYYTIVIKEADTFISWDFRRLRYTCL